ncbi:hypothetical protein [Serratia marcescens]|uniref:hypothetical protein n=1 Tax=Serratia marcescens TaxID=615 RepID=UPI00074527CB|nr:hypothetical protein [Serratia marcescens]CUZ48440.1 Uncharacterised protein [Serratia marcescens]CVA12984.1 Uncharacterised protein [Serratia marcescens]CVC89277.1 Uncharacterised protein [Serratia marcescens]CVE89401.1 Uncharacterised protein [Serratia marcescens]CVH34725.1 Uncharacterised protein [Serratia marcescens]
MKVTETKVLSIEITEVERLDPIRVMAENYEPGKGRITITSSARHGLLSGLQWVEILSSSF